MAEEVTTKFKVDISDLKRSISEAEQQMKLANAQFKLAASSMDDWGSSADGLSAKIKQLKKIVEAQESKLTAYKAQLARVQAAYEENGKRAQALKDKMKQLIDDGVDPASDEYKEYQAALRDVSKEQELNKKTADQLEVTILNQEAALNRTKKEMGGYEDSLEHVDDAADDLDDSLDDVDKAVRDASEGFTVMKGALANLVAQGIRAAIDGLKDLGKAAVEAYQEYDDGADTIIKKTGATGEAAQKLQESYKKVSQSVVGDFSDIGSALGEVSTRFGFTGEQLEDASVQFMKFADITGTDATSAVRLVSRAMGDAGIESDKYADLLDDLATASQASGISIETLTENITKYGAPMRALGFDTQESIAIFAGWEKAGVNTETAFAGMKTAISKWSAEGKDAKEEFKKTLDEIAKCPDIASATTKAIEIFGKKAGPDLADAIKGGRFEYSDFLELLEGSEGTVTKTYEATQDGFDKVKLAIQSGRAEIGEYVAELADKYAPQIEDFATDVVAGLKKVLQWTADNTRTLAKFGGALAGAFVISKVATFINTMSETVGVIKSVTTAIQGAETATKLLNIAQAATPWGLVALAVGGLTAAMIAYRDEQEAVIEAEYGLTDAQKESIAAAEESRKTYEEMDQTRKDSMAAISAEYGYLDELKNEYNGLIDENGKVKEGYEDRAEFILSQLASALGVERDEIQKNIDANGRLGDSIDVLIQKKQAEATLAANQDAYTEAIQKRDDALKTYQASLKTLDSAEKRYQKSVEESGDVLGTYQELLKTAPATAQDYYWANQDLIKGQQEAKDALDEARKGVEDSETAYVGYINTISNYEGLSASIIGGDADAIQDAMTNIQNSFITAENGTKTSLENQLRNAQQNYRDMKQAAAEGLAGVTQETVLQSADMVTKAKAELDKFNTSFNEAGQAAGSSYAAGVKGTSGSAQSAGQTLSAGAQKGASGDLSKQGKTTGATYGKGVKQGEKSAKSAGSDLEASVGKGATGDLSKEGRTTGETYARGVRGTDGTARAAGTGLKTQAQTGARTDLSSQGKQAGTSYASGVSSGKSGAKSAGSSLKNQAKSGASGGYSSMKSEGTNAAEGFRQGLLAKVKGVASAAASLVRNAIAAAKKAQESQSPSRIWREEIGSMAGEGYVVGLASMIRPAMKEAQTLVKDSISAASKEVGRSASDFGSLGSSLMAGASYAAGSVSAPVYGGGSSRGGAASGGTTITYNQTINAPSAPSRIEIYRQTRNLLEFTKGGA